MCFKAAEHFHARESQHRFLEREPKQGVLGVLSWVYSALMRKAQCVGDLQAMYIYIYKWGMRRPRRPSSTRQKKTTTLPQGKALNSGKGLRRRDIGTIGISRALRPTCFVGNSLQIPQAVTEDVLLCLNAVFLVLPKVSPLLQEWQHEEEVMLKNLECLSFFAAQGEVPLLEPNLLSSKS